MVHYGVCGAGTYLCGRRIWDEDRPPGEAGCGAGRRARWRCACKIPTAYGAGRCYAGTRGCPSRNIALFLASCLTVSSSEPALLDCPPNFEQRAKNIGSEIRSLSITETGTTATQPQGFGCRGPPGAGKKRKWENTRNVERRCLTWRFDRELQPGSAACDSAGYLRCWMAQRWTTIPKDPVEALACRDPPQWTLLRWNCLQYIVNVGQHLPRKTSVH
jgi:hypothetical protein